MPENPSARRYRFGIFEADAATGELRRQGLRVRLNAQPFQVLVLLLERPGEVLTREEIERALWPDGTVVDYTHGVNSAINRIREALGDTAANPRFIETLARRGYRFVAPVELVAPMERIDSRGNGKEHAPESGLQRSAGVSQPTAPPAPPDSAAQSAPVATATEPERETFRVLATPQDLPQAPPALVRTLFVLLQLMYLGFYIGALSNLPEIRQLLSPMARAEVALDILIVTAVILIPVRAFTLCAALFGAPHFRQQFLRLWPFLLVLDVLWALSPFLLLHHIDIGEALVCMALLVYSPFAQRALMLMGAGSGTRPQTAAE